MPAGIQGQTATNKDNNISKIAGLHCCEISSYMACFCKPMAQNWHKILTSCVRVVILLGGCMTVKNWWGFTLNDHESNSFSLLHDFEEDSS